MLESDLSAVLVWRQGGVLSYLFSDHLGSTTVTADSSGTKTAEMRYKPCPQGVLREGETRYTSGTTPTARHYTGQYEENSIGLYFYNARWYDPLLGRFAQADTLIPQPGSPLAWDRFAYSRNNPVNYNDPSGHWPEWFDPIGQFFTGLSFEFARTSNWMGAIVSPGAANSLAPSSDETDAMWAGRIAGDVLTIAVGVVEVAGGVTIGGGGAAVGCGATLCLASAPAIAAGAVVLTAGVSTSLSGGAALGENIGKMYAKGGETSDTVRGKDAHQNYKTALGDDYVYNRELPSGKRPDAVDWLNNIVRELKPDTPNAISKGLKQLNGYVQELQQITGQTWQSFLDVYKK